MLLKNCRTIAESKAWRAVAVFHPIDLMSVEVYRNVDAVFLDYEEQLQSKVWRAVAVFHLGEQTTLFCQGWPMFTLEGRG